MIDSIPKPGFPQRGFTHLARQHLFDFFPGRRPSEARELQDPTTLCAFVYRKQDLPGGGGFGQDKGLIGNFVLL